MWHPHQTTLGKLTGHGRDGAWHRQRYLTRLPGGRGGSSKVVGEKRRRIENIEENVKGSMFLLLSSKVGPSGYALKVPPPRGSSSCSIFSTPPTPESRCPVFSLDPPASLLLLENAESGTICLSAKNIP